MKTIPKKDIWAAIWAYCTECMGTGRDYSQCKNLQDYGECDLFIYRGKQNREQNGKIRPGFSKKDVLKRIKNHCRRICLNGLRLDCDTPQCPLFIIANCRTPYRSAKTEPEPRTLPTPLPKGDRSPKAYPVGGASIKFVDSGGPS